MQDHDYIRNQFSAWKAGPPYRTLLESGIPIGAGSDSAVVGALNPWFGIYFMTTGKDAGGDLLLPGQQISRKDALRLYTAANAWFNFEENDMGTIEAGKAADIILVDRRAWGFIPLNDPVRQLAFSATSEAVTRPMSGTPWTPAERTAPRSLARQPGLGGGPGVERPQRFDDGLGGARHGHVHAADPRSAQGTPRIPGRARERSAAGRRGLRQPRRPRA